MGEVNPKKSRTQYGAGGTIERWTISYRNKEVLHRIGRPAEIWYRRDGSVDREFWYFRGARHREDGPAALSYYPSGKLQQAEWYVNGRLHREDGPAYEAYSQCGEIVDQQWRIEGRRIEDW